MTFATNQYAITPAFTPLLNDLATTLNQNPQVTASIVGYTDSTSLAQLNQTLSQNRAQSVVNALAQRGVNGGRLSAQGMGASNPIADNATEPAAHRTAASKSTCAQRRRRRATRRKRAPEASGGAGNKSKKFSNFCRRPWSVFTVRGWCCRRVTILLLSLLLRGRIRPVLPAEIVLRRSTPPSGMPLAWPACFGARSRAPARVADARPC